MEIKTQIYSDKVHELEEVNDDLYQKIIGMETLIEYVKFVCGLIFIAIIRSKQLRVFKITKRSWDK
jgi:hypothetical protein